MNGLDRAAQTPHIQLIPLFAPKPSSLWILSFMPEQLLLPGFEAARQPTDRLFFVILPDRATAACISQLAYYLRAEHGLKGRPLLTNRLHVTLHPPGDYAGLPHDLVTLASVAAATVSMRPFEVTFDRAMSFESRRGNRPFVLLSDHGTAALMAFQQALGEALRQIGLVTRAQSHYTPHVALRYDGCRTGRHVVETVGWTVREFVLVHSLLGRTRHVPRGRWPLLA
jgi:2'-5' RNA ligase